MQRSFDRLDVTIIACQACGAKNALLIGALSGRNKCRKCRAVLDMSPEARETARAQDQQRKQFLEGTPMLHQALDEFYITSKLGSGAMAVVFRAHDTVLERDVAIKVFPPATSSEAAKFQRDHLTEARAACKLVHPHVVQVFRIGEAKPDDFPEPLRYIAMELVDGSTVERKLTEQGKLDVPYALRLFTQMTAALADAHRMNVLHRDIKPANMLLTRGGELKLTDFGFAVQAGDVNDAVKSGGVVGTPAYMSPESARGESLSAKSDMYMLGVVMWEMMVGERPFKGNRRDVLQQHMEVPAPDIRPRTNKLPEVVAQLLMQCLDKNPDVRPTAEQAQAILRRIDIRGVERALDLANDRTQWPLARAAAQTPKRADAESPYIRVLQLRSDPFAMLSSAQYCYSWPALRGFMDKLNAAVHGVPAAALISGPRGSGRTVVADLLANRLQTPPVFLDAASVGPRGLIVEFVGRMLFQLAKVADHSGEYVRPLVERVTSKDDLFNDPAQVMDLVTLIGHYQAVLRTVDPLVAIVDNVDRVEPRRAEELLDLTRLLARTPVRLVILDGKISYVGERLTNTTLPGREAAQLLQLPAMEPGNVGVFLKIKLMLAGGTKALPHVTNEAAQVLCDAADGRPAALQNFLHRCLLISCVSHAGKIDENVAREATAGEVDSTGISKTSLTFITPLR